jgi:lysophospholipase L1-like esterase
MKKFTSKHSYKVERKSQFRNRYKAVFLKNQFKIFLITSLLICFEVKKSSGNCYLISNNDTLVNSLVFTDGQALVIEGRGFTDVESPYNRLPKKAKGMVREPVYRLAGNSSGIAIRFETNSTKIGAKWTLKYNTTMPHMAPTGIKGVDLYARVNNKWQFVMVGKPDSLENATILITNMIPVWREFMLYLPLYEGVKNVEIGIEKNAQIRKPALRTTKPIVMYGTSITQGGCASRPGMAYPAIVGRSLDLETINLGFSGNGWMDLEVVELMAEIDAACYVLDNIPNMNLEQIQNNLPKAVKYLKSKRPDVPVLIIESIMFEHTFFDTNMYKVVNEKNKLQANVYLNLIKEQTGIYYLSQQNFIGIDHEGTVDGIHLSDVGFIRFSEIISNKLKEILIK